MEEEDSTDMGTGSSSTVEPTTESDSMEAAPGSMDTSTGTGTTTTTTEEIETETKE